MLRILVFLVPAIVIATSSPAWAQRSPDLTVEITGYHLGQRGNVQALVTNQGRTAAGPSRIDLTIDPPPHGVHFKQLGEIAPGEQVPVIISGTVRAGATLMVTVDSQDEVREANERNNQARQRVEDAAPPPEPEQPDEPEGLADLSVEIIDVTGGDRGVVTVTVRNEGEVANPRNRVRLERNGERNVDTRVPVIEPGRAANVQLKGKLPEGTPFTVTVDPEEQIDESDEGNNRAEGRVPNAVEPPTPPPEPDPVEPDKPVEPDQPIIDCECDAVTSNADLVVSIIDIRRNGDALKVRARVENIGSDSTDEALVTLTVNSGQVEQYTASVPGLGPGETAEVAFDAALHDSTVEAYVDSGFTVPEANEGNNSSHHKTVPRQPQEPVVAGPPVAMLGGVPVAIATGLVTGVHEVAGHHDSDPPSKVAVLRYPDGTGLKFVEDDLSIETDVATATALAARYNGAIVDVVERDQPGRSPTFIIHIDVSKAPVVPYEPNDAEPALVSSERALALLSIVVAEQGNGVPVWVDFVFDRLGAFGASYTEADGVDSKTLSYVKAGGALNVDLVNAWKALEIAGSTQNSVLMGIIDSGFEAHLDFPKMASFTGGPPPDDIEHGTLVTSAAASKFDNGIGGAGPAGYAANHIVFEAGYKSSQTQPALLALAETGVRIINMSFGGYYPIKVPGFPIESPPSLASWHADTAWVASKGILMFAGAGNDGENDDASYFADGPEYFDFLPCESANVICVSGWADGEAKTDPSSNWGSGGGETVDIAGPYVMFVGPAPKASEDAGQTLLAGGTSFASPFVAGVAALVLQANPNLSSAEVWTLLDKYAQPAKGGLRVVNAYQPVRDALMMSGKSFAPVIDITSPDIGDIASQSTPMTLTASTFDVEDGPNGGTVTWTSTVDGDLGTGTSIQYSFAGKPLGTRVIKATVTDSSGNSLTDSVAITVTNVKPKVTIIEPATASTVQTGVTYTWRAEVLDDSTPVYLPMADCSGLKWIEGDDTGANPLGEGCEINVKFDTPGNRNIWAEYTDAYGEKSFGFAMVHVTEPTSVQWGLNITQPSEGYAYSATERIPLAYELSDPGAKPDTAYKIVWKVARKGWPLVPLTPEVDAEGQFFRIENVLPGERFSTKPGEFVIELSIIDPKRPWSGQPVQRTFSFLAQIN